MHSLSLSDQNKQWLMAFGICLVMTTLMLMVQNAFAGADSGTDNEFDSIWETLVGWTQGTFGRIVALAMVVVGIVGGIARQSLMAFAVGIGGGMGLYNSSGVIDVMMGAAVTETVNAIPAATQIVNGLI